MTDGWDSIGTPRRIDSKLYLVKTIADGQYTYSGENDKYSVCVLPGKQCTCGAFSFDRRDVEDRRCKHTSDAAELFVWQMRQHAIGER